MALVNNGLDITTLPDGQVPSGAGSSPVTRFDDAEYIDNRVISVGKTGVEDSDKATTFDSIVNAIGTQVTAVITADFISTNTVTYFAEVLNITSNAVSNTSVGDFYTDAAVNYLCSVRIYTKTS